jgi:anti-repressor protein
MSLTIFQFENESIRFVDGRPVAVDVAKALGYAHPSSTIAKLVDLENKGVADLATPGGTQSAAVLEEAGIYQLIFSSKLPSAKKFQQWVFSEVLPSIRKTGTYSIVPKTYSEALLEAGRLQAQIEADADATALGKAIAKAPNNIRIGDFAKSIGMGQNRYFDELRDDGIIQQTSTLPYQRFLDAKYFVVTQVISGNGKTYPVSLITPKGQAYLAKRHNKYVSREAMRDAIECQVVAIV